MNNNIATNDNKGPTLSEEEITKRFIDIRPSLLNFAKQKDFENAEDLVSITFLKVLLNREKYFDVKAGGFKAWCFTILRNELYNNFRKIKLEVQDTDNIYTRNIPIEGYQEESLELDQLSRIMRSMPKYDRDILTYIGVLGLSYEEASLKLNLPIGTLKSSFNRAKEKIKEKLESNITDNKHLSKNELNVNVLWAEGKSISEISNLTGLKRSKIMEIIG